MLVEYLNRFESARIRATNKRKRRWWEGENAKAYRRMPRDVRDGRGAAMGRMWWWAGLRGFGCYATVNPFSLDGLVNVRYGQGIVSSLHVVTCILSRL